MMYLRFKTNIVGWHHETHTFRFTRKAPGSFPEHNFYCAICEIDGEACSFYEDEITNIELVDDQRVPRDPDNLRAIAAEIDEQFDELNDAA
jgi:hypothetical protein